MRLPPWTYEPVSWQTEYAEDATFVEIVKGALRAEPAGWTVRVRAPFCVVAAERPLRSQGWKLHVSATLLSAAAVLERALPILVERRCHFKFVRSARELTLINAANAPEGMSGKFVTIYPIDDVEAVAIAMACDGATAGLPGPRILSDRPLRPGSLVHYRYGAFTDRLERWTILEQREDIVIAPNGEVVPDARSGHFAPPAWAIDPFPRETTPPPPAGDGSVRLASYRVNRLVSRSNRGGVYRATSPEGHRVVVKEARPHVATDRFGRDARDRLRHEREILAILAVNGICPTPIELFAGGDHLFLAMEDVGRRSLREEIVNGATGRGRALGEEALRVLARQLAGLLAGAHAAGVIVRDLNPGNLVRGDDGVVRMVDLEAAHAVDDPAPWFRAATPAYASPQQENDLRPTPADDVFSLGATLFFAATATDPFFFPDDEGGRPVAQKVEDLLRLHGLPPWASDLIQRCLATSPAARPEPAEITEAIERTARVAFPAGISPEPAPGELGLAVDGVIAYLDAARAARDGDRIWPTTSLGRRTDPLNVMNGNAGVGLFLCQAAGQRPAARVLLDEAVGVTLEAIGRDRDRPVGLYFGLAGVAWFLAEAGRVADDQALIEAAVRLLSTLPEVVGTPDLAQGNAGLCLVAARFALLTGDSLMSTRASAAADALLGTATETPFGQGWVIPRTHTPDGVEKIYPGYGYGATGVAYALLAATHATGEERFAAQALEALRGVVEAGRTKEGGWHWPTSNAFAPAAPGWLKGAAGIGAGMVRAWAMTGEPRFREAALGCLDLLQPIPAAAPLVQLHGLAGVGDFLLDCRTFIPGCDVDAPLRAVLRIIHAQRVDRRAAGFGLFFPDEEGLAGADFGTGVAGVASFLLRGEGGGPRPMTQDDLPSWPVAVTQ